MIVRRAAVVVLALGMGGCASVRTSAPPEPPRAALAASTAEVAASPGPPSPSSPPGAVVPAHGELPEPVAPAGTGRPLESPEPPPSLPVFAPPTGRGTSLSAEEVRLLVEGAARMHRYRYARVGKGPAYKVDCSTFVRGLFLQLGFDTFWPKTNERPPGSGGGVGLLRWYASLHGSYVSSEQLAENPGAFAPQPGDVVFFHNTTDRNRNRRYDDLLTHVGIVESVDPSGTVTYLHAGGHIVGRGNMTLDQPRTWKNAKGDILNHYIRNPRRWDKKDSPRFAGELFAGYARFLRPLYAPSFAAETAPLLTPTGKKFEERRKGTHQRAQSGARGKQRTKQQGKARR